MLAQFSQHGSGCMPERMPAHSDDPKSLERRSNLPRPFAVFPFDEVGILPSEPGYGFLIPICLATAASSILTGRSLGRVQFLKRCGTTA
jgi:hypothetical protein